MNLSLETVLRCLDLIPIIRENQGIELAELARRTNIPEKLIAKQLIPMLLLCGAPPYLPHDYVSVWLEDDRVYCGFADHFRRPVTLLPIELVALHQALSSVKVAVENDPRTAERLEALAMKIERALPEEQRVFLDQSDRVVVDDFSDGGSPFLTDVTNAVQERRKLEIEYLSFGETKTKRRIVHPLGVLVKDGQSYVPAFDELRGRVVSFRLDRIAQTKRLAQWFEPPADFTLEKYAQTGLSGARPDDDHEITIRITGRTARWVSEVFEPSRWSWKDRETLVLLLTTSRLAAAVRWVLTLGTDAEVVGPAEARELAAREIQSLAQAYARPL